MDIKKVMVAGSGVLGSQIAFQTAYNGYEVTVYDINEEALEKAKERFKGLKIDYKEDLGATQEVVDAAFDRLTLSTDLTEAVKNADLVIEAVPEVLDIKKGLYEKLAKVAPEKTSPSAATAILKA